MCLVKIKRVRRKTPVTVWKVVYVYAVWSEEPSLPIFKNDECDYSFYYLSSPFKGYSYKEGVNKSSRKSSKLQKGEYEINDGFHFFTDKKDALEWASSGAVVIECVVKPQDIIAKGLFHDAKNIMGGGDVCVSWNSLSATKCTVVHKKGVITAYQKDREIKYTRVKQFSIRS